MPNWKLYLFRLILLGTSLLLTALVVEFGLRLIRPSDPIGDSVSFIRHDPNLGWEKQPGAEGRRVTDEYTSFERINAQGQRGPERTHEKPPGTSRVLVLGDSFVEGYQVEEDEVFTHLLEGELNAESESKWEVINGGTIGYSTDQSLLFFRESGRLFEPDVTILVFFLNDVWFNSVSDAAISGANQPIPKPLFELSSGRLELTAVPVPDPAGYEVGAPKRRRGTIGWLKAHSRIFALLKNAIRSSALLHALAIDLGLAGRPQYGQLSIDTPIPVPDVYRVWEVNAHPEMESAWQLTETLMLDLRDDVERQGGEFVLFYAPSIVEVVEEFWLDTRRKYGLADDEWDRDLPRTKIHDIAARNDLSLIDPLEAMRVSYNAGSPPYFENDRHWNETGHVIVAGAMVERVLRLPGSSGVER